MRNLLNANFFRLWRSRAFWGSVAVMFAVGVFELAVGANARRNGIPVPLENRYMLFVLMSGIVLSAFCSLFVGAEHSDGRLRCKIAAGHSRSAVYASQLIVSSAAGVMACLGYILPMVLAGIPLMGAFTLPLPAILWFTLCALLMTAALCTVFTTVSMLYQNKAAVAITCISLAYFLLFLGIFLNSRLMEQSVIPAQEYIENGRILVQEAMPNPAYVQGIKRRLFELLYDLPGCQAVQLLAEAEACPVRLPLVSLGAIAAVMAVGQALFRQKDLK